MTTTKRKGFLRSYIQSITGIVFVAFCFVYPYLLMFFNPPPMEAQTEILRGEVLQAQKQHPNVWLRLPNGTVQALDFPSDLQAIYAAKFPNFYGIDEEKLAQFKGCAAEVKIDRLQGLMIPSNPRIWSLKCDRLKISYEALSKYYLQQREFDGLRWFVFIGMGFFLVLMIRGDSINRSK